MSLKQLIRDLWRGWSEEDLISAKDKLTAADQRPGGVVRLTKREMKAIIANSSKTT